MDELGYFLLGVSLQSKYKMKDEFHIQLLPPHHPHHVLVPRFDRNILNPNSQLIEVMVEVIELDKIGGGIWCAYDKEENILILQLEERRMDDGWSNVHRY